MIKKMLLFSKIPLFVILFFFITISVFSTSGYNLDFNNYYSKNLEKTIQQDKYAYGFNAYPGPEGIVKFKLDEPWSLEDLMLLNCPFIYCGTFTNYGTWLVYDAEGILWEIYFCDMPFFKCIGGGDVRIYDLSINPVNNKIFGITDNTLYEINRKTGNQTYICSYDNFLFAGIAFDKEGTLYAWDFKHDALWTIDIETDEITLIGPLGISINFAVSGDFDYDTDTLYLAVYTHTGQLYKCDKETGECELIGSIGSGVEIFGFSVPLHYDLCQPYTTISLDPPEPDGEGGWYVSDVKVTLNAIDELSGVREIRYRTVEGEWKVHIGDFLELILDYDCLDDGLIKYYAVDNGGTREETKKVEIDIDQHPPEIKYNVTVVIEGLISKIYVVTISTLYFDNCSGIERIDLFINDELQDTIPGSGPEYVWTFRYNKRIPKIFYKIRVYDFAGHYSDIIINSSDIHTKSRINHFEQFSNNVLFRWFFNRFALIERLLNPIKSN